MSGSVDVSPRALRIFAARNTRRDTPIREMLQKAADRIEELEIAREAGLLLANVAEDDTRRLKEKDLRIEELEKQIVDINAAADREADDAMMRTVHAVSWRDP